MRRSQRGVRGLVRCRPQAFLTATVPSLTAVHVVAFFLERHGAAALTCQPGTPGTKLPFPLGVLRVVSGQS